LNKYAIPVPCIPNLIKRIEKLIELILKVPPFFAIFNF
jgi:hypothetical protein